MTKKHFIDAAAIVRNILNGEWTAQFPPWAASDRNMTPLDDEDDSADVTYTRAVQTAEAFIVLFQQHNPRFDVNRFLVACELIAKPAKVRKVKAAAIA